MSTNSKPRKPDLSISGSGIYFLSHNTQRGRAWIQRNVHYERWQIAADRSISIDGSSMAQDIADAAVRGRLLVEVNCRKYLGNNRVQAGGTQ